MVDNTVDIINIKNSCRLCLADENEIDLNEIYKSGCIPFNRIASLLIDVELLENEMFSNKICQECASKLILFYKFKQKCVLTNRILLDLIEKAETPTSEADLENTVDSNTQDFAKSASDDEYLLEDLHYTTSPSDIAMNDTTKQTEPLDKAKQSKFQCEECGKIFSQYFGLTQHYQQHTNEKKFECKICKMEFTRLYNVTIHMRLHNNERPYECEECGRKFVKSGDLARHRRIHKDEKNYKCFVCLKAFKRSTDVTSHMRSHTGEKRYKCSHCEKAYSSHSGLKKHIMKYHKIV